MNYFYKVLNEIKQADADGCNVMPLKCPELFNKNGQFNRRGHALTDKLCEKYNINSLIDKEKKEILFQWNIYVEFRKSKNLT